MVREDDEIGGKAVEVIFHILTFLLREMKVVKRSLNFFLKSKPSGTHPQMECIESWPGGTDADVNPFKNIFNKWKKLICKYSIAILKDYHEG